MARKSIGYTRLEWTCPNCGTRNPGPKKVCAGCGAAQPADVKFEQTEGAALVSDAAEIEKAKAGPDIHCAYCGARNPAGTAVCVNCGGDLKEGQKRETGGVVGAYQGEKKEEKPCPTCGAPNPVNALTCAKCGSALAKPAAVETPKAAPRKISPLVWVGLGILALVIAICAIVGLSRALKTEELTGTVQDVAWQRTVLVEVLGPVEKQGWKADLPADAAIIDCGYKYSGESDQPAPVATEVCGTPYTVDEGTGFGEVVQDCVFQVYEEACRYTVEEWHAGQSVVLQGRDLDPRWPDAQVASNQRLGERSEEYKITFSADGETYTYTTSDAALFQQARPGSTWSLTVNGLGDLVSIEPQ